MISDVMTVLSGVRRRTHGRRAAAAALIAVLATLTAACGARPNGDALRPVAAMGAGKRVTVYVATTRTPDAAAPGAFTAGRSDALHYARYVIAIPPGHKPSEIEWPQGRPDPAKSFATLEATALSETQFRQAVAAEAPKAKGAAAVFVHGYNYNFQESLFRAAQLYADAGVGGAQILFAWPSEASPLAYVADKDAATFSRDALADVVNMVASESRVRKLTLFSHSMGGWLSMEALRQLRLTGQGAAYAKFENVVLAAPDIDVDVFVKQLETVGRLSPPLIVLVARDDGALNISRLLSVDRPRVGLADVDDPRIQAAAKAYDVRVIDISAIASSGDLNHGRYAGVAALYPRFRSQLEGRSGGTAAAGAYLLNPGAAQALRSAGAAQRSPSP